MTLLFRLWSTLVPNKRDILRRFLGSADFLENAFPIQIQKALHSPGLFDRLDDRSRTGAQHQAQDRASHDRDGQLQAVGESVHTENDLRNAGLKGFRRRSGAFERNVIAQCLGCGFRQGESKPPFQQP